MTATRKITRCVLAAGALLLLAPAVLVLLPPATAFAGTYYMHVCPYYGQAAGPFAWQSDATDLTNPTCGMQAQRFVLYGRYGHWIAYSPPGILITAVYTPPYQTTVDCSLGSGSGQDGFAAQYFWAGGAKTIDNVFGGINPPCYGTMINQAIGPSSYFGWGVTCVSTVNCTPGGFGEVLTVNGVQLQLTENSGPGLLALGSNNLWYQTGHWVRGGGWPVTFAASDPSGVCGTDLLVNGQFTQIDLTQDTPNASSFQQCPMPKTVSGTLNTGSNGPLTIGYAANNAAGVVTAPSQTLEVDNTPVSLTLTTPNDSDPNVWVNHAVRVVATPSAGPSGIAATNCSTNGGAGYVYPAGGTTVNGTGVWTIACTSLNNAVAVDGTHASATQTMAVHIDETPPAVAFAPVNPADPQAVVANTNDGQSGVGGGQIMMHPASGGAWQSLGTVFDGQHLLARFDDAALSPGPWVIQATSCDRAGNCASIDETLKLPMRTASVSRAGFLVATDPRLTARRCVEKKVEVGRHHRVRRRLVCEAPRLVLKSRERVSFGRSAVVHGVLTTATGAPIAGAPITLYTAPQNGLYQYAPAASARTSSAGTWWARLPPGPSQLIDAVYGGSPTIQPSQSWDHLSVPARVKVLRVWPRHVQWGGKVHVEAQLVGGYLPPEGALVRLRLGYGNSKVTYGVKEHVGGNGIFQVTNTFGPGPAALLLRYWLQECTLPEGDYPFAPACGPRNFVAVGGG